MQRNPVLLIVGKAPSVWDEVEAFMGFGVPHDVCCLNEIGLRYPRPFRFWYACEAHILVTYATPGPELHSIRHATRPDVDGVRHWPTEGVWPGNWPRGGSAMQSAVLALARWGYSRVVLAGVDLTDRRYALLFGPEWGRQAKRLRGRVRGFGGLPGRLLGHPDAVWLRLYEQEPLGG